MTAQAKSGHIMKYFAGIRQYHDVHEKNWLDSKQSSLEIETLLPNPEKCHRPQKKKLDKISKNLARVR